MGATRRAFRQKSASRRRSSYTSLSARAPEAIPGRSARFSALELRHRGFQPVGPLRRRIGPQQQLRAQRETDTLSLRRLPPRKPKGRRFSPACQSKSRTLLPPRQAGLPQPPVRHFQLVCRIGSSVARCRQPGPTGHCNAQRVIRFRGTKRGVGAFSAAMSRTPHHHKAESPFQASEAERLARAQKNARLKDLRTHASWLVLDPQAHFQEVIDCSALLGDLPIRKIAGDG